MARLFTITTKDITETNRLLEEACVARSVEYKPIFLEDLSSLPTDITSYDLLYKVQTSVLSSDLEKMLMLQGPQTFYGEHAQHYSASHPLAYTCIHEHAGVPIPKTAYFPSTELAKLQADVDALGGYPIILKAVGGQHGVGVMKLDSLSSLSSVADYLAKKDVRFVLRQFITSDSHARLIVLGNNVVDSIRYKQREGDIRTNVGAQPLVEAAKFSEVVEQVAVKAVTALGLEFGGVDVIMDEAGNPYVMEVNFPCYFPRCQMLTGTDISGMMLDYLLAKSKKID